MICRFTVHFSTLFFTTRNLISNNVANALAQT
jgi:hypothetical protein